MIFRPFTRAVCTAVDNNAAYKYDERRAHSVKTGNLTIWGLGLLIMLVVGAIGINYVLSTPPLEVAVWFVAALMLGTYSYDALKALDAEDIRLNLQKKTALLARDRTLNAEWKRRAKAVHRLAKQLGQKQRRYGNYPEIEKARIELEKAVDCIIRFNMMMHTDHAEIQRREVDSILVAYGELP